MVKRLWSVMNAQTRIIVVTAVALTAIDLTVRGLMMQSVRPVSVQAQGDVLTVREIRLVDNAGNLKAHLYTDENAEPGLVLFDRNGVNRAQLDTFQNIPSLILHRPDGQRSTYFGMDENGRSIFDMYGDNGEELASIDVTGNRTTAFSANLNSVTFHGETLPHFCD